MLRHLRATHRAAKRVEDGLRGVVDDRGIKLVAVAQRLAVQQQAFRVLQQAVVVTRSLRFSVLLKNSFGFMPSGTSSGI
jgi:hypothetical protein